MAYEQPGERIRVTVDAGKYTFIQYKDGTSEILRDKVSWIGPTAGLAASNVILAMAHELDAARAVVDRVVGHTHGIYWSAEDTEIGANDPAEIVDEVGRVYEIQEGLFYDKNAFYASMWTVETPNAPQRREVQRFETADEAEAWILQRKQEIDAVDAKEAAAKEAATRYDAYEEGPTTYQRFPADDTAWDARGATD